MKKVCSVDGCDKPFQARGLCNAHYRRFRLTGVTGGELRTSPGTLISWIEQNVGHEGDECLIWPFSRDDKGYGQITFRGRHTSPHRVFCVLAHGEPPFPKAEAGHACGNGNLGCVHPKHVRWISKSQNELDKVLHGTGNQGVGNPSAKLTEDQVREIDALKGYLSQRKIAKKFGTNKTTVARIHNGTGWSSVLIQKHEQELAA